MSHSTVIFDVIDSIGKWWFRVRNNKGIVSIEYKGKVNYNQNTQRTKLVICEPSTTIEYVYDKDYIDANYERGIVIVSDNGLTWKFYKNGVTDTTLSLSVSVLCDSYYSLGPAVKHTSYTDLRNYMIWLDCQSTEVKMEYADKLIMATS